MAVIKAKQLTSSGLVTDKRALFKQLLVFHPISSDTEFKFYDLTTAPVGGEPYYSFFMYGKGRDAVTFPEPGVLFDDGIYAEVAAGCRITVLYEEV
jgi:hypothetical protein